MKLNCRKTLFLFLARKHVFRPLSFSLCHRTPISLSPYLNFHHLTRPPPVHASSFSPFRPPFIPSLFPVFAQLTRVSICFIKLRRAPFYSSLLFHSRRDISTTHSPSSTSIPSLPLTQCHSRHFSFKIEVRGETRRKEGEPPLRPSDPSTLSYKFNTARSFPTRLFPSLLSFLFPAKSCLDILTNERIYRLALWKNIRSWWRVLVKGKRSSGNGEKNARVSGERNNGSHSILAAKCAH